MLASAAFALTAFVPWPHLVAPGAIPVVEVVAGDSTPWPLAPEEARRHTIALEAGQFVQVTVIQAGIDVTVRLYAPDGTAGDVVDANEGPRGWEPASVLATTSGEHVIEVRGSTEAPDPGHYVLDAKPVRIGEPRDLRRLIAEQARARGAVGLGPRAVYSRRPRPRDDLISESLSQLPLAAGIFRALDESCWEADSLTFLALLQGWKHRYADLLDHHPRALELWEACGDRYKYAEAHNYAAEGYARAAQYVRAAETYERGLAVARELGAADLELLLLNNAAGVYNVLGETDKALRYGEQALSAIQAQRIQLLETTALHNLARAHLRRGELQQAADRAMASMTRSSAIQDWVGEIMASVILGEVYLALGEPLQARRFLTEFLAAKDRDLAAIRALYFFPLLARTFEDAGDRAIELELLEGSLAAQQSWGYRVAEPDSLLALGRFHLRDGAWDMAWEAAHQALEVLRESGNRFDVARALELRGDAALGRGEVASAQSAFEECLKLRRDIGDAQGEAMALQRLAVVDLVRGDARAAQARLEDALRSIEGARARIPSPELRSTWLGNFRAVHETYVDALMERHRRSPGEGWDARAFEAAESSRARSLLDLLAESRTNIRRGMDPELLAQERSLRERLGGRLDLQVRLLAASTATPGGNDLARDIQRLSAEYEEVQGRLRAGSPRYAALTRPAPLSLEQLRSQVLDHDTLLLEYSLGPDRSYLWVVGCDSFAVHELPGRAAFEAAIRRARGAITRRTVRADDRRALASLSRLLLGPVRPDLTTRRLLVVADGLLHHVPFAALPDEQGRPLVRSHEVVNAPSASVLALLRAGEAARPRPSRTIAVVADPVFDRGDSRVRASTQALAASDAVLERATRDFGFAAGRLPRLSFTRQEARSILALEPRGRLALDFAASRATVQDPELREYRFVHFATHGLLNDVRPELSGLVLSLVDRDGRDTRGLLTAPDVFNLELGADLVVLSGCRTALGREVRGEGLVGLTRAFMYAGVPRVVASLWPVEDLATAELMKSFYEGILGPQKLPPAAALRQAQARMARHPRWSAPYYWAGFQLQGDWR